MVISGQDGNNSRHECWLLDKSMNIVDSWKFRYTQSFFWTGLCQIPGGFVAIGGKNKNECAMFTLSPKSWKMLEPLQAPRDRHGSVFMKGRIFLFGGFVSHSQSSSVISLN